MTELIELRRFKPTTTHSYLLSDYSDDESFPILPMINDKPFVYQRVYTPNLIEERPLTLYRSCETPVRRIIRVSSPSPPETNVHLPKHTKKLVNRFLNNLKHAHDDQHTNGNESDSSIDDCDVCRRLRSAMNEGKRRSTSEEDLYQNSRVVFETLNSSKQIHSKYCKVCHLLGKSDFGISDRTKNDKHVHVIETFPSNNPPAITTSQASIYPLGYTTFVDPNTGLTYAYDPNWQYNTNLVYRPNNPQSYPSTMDKATYTRMTDDDDTRHNSNDKTLIVHTSRNPTPKIILEQPRRYHRRSRKNRSKTIVTERTTRIPRTYTTTYI